MQVNTQLYLLFKNIVKYKDNVRKQLIKRMLYSYLHSFNNKRTKSLYSWEPAMEQPLSVVFIVALFKVTPPRVLFESPSRLFEPNTARSLWVDAKESRRLRTWASASLKSRKKVAKESQSKHPLSLLIIHFFINFTFVYNLLTSVHYLY